MTLSRRSFSLALVSPWLLPAASPAADWSFLDRLPRAGSFGLSGSGEPLDSATLYRDQTPGGAPLSFELSNGQIAASLNRHGVIEKVCVNNGIVPLPEASLSGGVYTAKLHRRAGPWTIRRTGAVPGALSLINAVIPEFSWTEGDLQIRQMSFAPIDVRDPNRSPRALLTVLVLRNASATAKEYQLEIAGVEPQALSAPRLTLRPGGQGVIEFALLLDPDASLLARLRSQSARQWFEDTHLALAGRFGRLLIPGAVFYQEAPRRAAENCRQSFLHLPDGNFGGGFMGSDIDTRDSNWNKDTYYAVLGAGLTEPSRLAHAIRYYFRWGLPPKPTARGLARFPGSGATVQSLSLAAAPLALAAAYYRLSGDKRFFQSDRSFLAMAERRAEEILETRRGDAFLFPSMFISNGDARGHFHTGSNVVAWYGFSGLARLAREVYQDDAVAQRWSEVASRLEAAIAAYCIKPGAQGPQFVEGVYEDTTYVPGHDGEESDTTLMPFYGFRPADCPELIRHARTGLSVLNPYYAPGLDGIWWHNHGGFRPATAPAWATGLAAASTRTEVAQRLSRFRELADLDGSHWWWPYKYGETDRRKVLRGNGATKCAWTSALYLIRFVEDILGARVDVPSRSLTFAPFVPWPKFSWQGAKLGAAHFDLEFEASTQRQIAQIRNRNAEPYTIRCRFTSANSNPLQPASAYPSKATEYFGFPAVEFEVTVAPGQSVEFMGRH